MGGRDGSMSMMEWMTRRMDGRMENKKNIHETKKSSRHKSKNKGIKTPNKEGDEKEGMR